MLGLIWDPNCLQKSSTDLATIYDLEVMKSRFKQGFEVRWILHAKNNVIFNDLTINSITFWWKMYFSPKRDIVSGNVISNNTLNAQNTPPPPHTHLKA